MPSPLTFILRTAERQAIPAHLGRKTLSFLSQRRSWTTLAREPDGLVVHALGNKRLPYIWLRDSCPSAECVHHSNRQKLHRTSDVPLDITPRAAPDAVRVTSTGIEIDWVDGHASAFPRAFLELYTDRARLAQFHYDDALREAAWTHAEIAQIPNLFMKYADIHHPAGFVQAIEQLSRYGLLFLRGVPNEKTADETCEVRKLAERFGEIRETFYGRLWDVVNLHNSKNIAYTNLDLGLHMDLLYFQYPPRYQILHCIRNQVVGGTSIFVDALNAARTLRSSHPDDFNLLTTTPVEFHYVNDGHHLHRSHPTIQLTASGEISHINYSPPFQAPLDVDTPPAFYGALKKFADLLGDPANTYEYTLAEGDVVMFDNRRVLHARTAFSDKENTGANIEGEPNRWLKGCYVEADALLDRVRVLKTKLGKDD